MGRKTITGFTGKLRDNLEVIERVLPQSQFATNHARWRIKCKICGYTGIREDSTLRRCETSCFCKPKSGSWSNWGRHDYLTKLKTEGKLHCCRCNQIKPIEEFSNDHHKSRTKTGTGRCSYCKVCDRWIKLERAYSITQKEYLEILDKQNNLCAICSKPFGAIVGLGADCAVVDHDHYTGKVRGIIHSNCNQLIGWAHDDPEILRGAIRYLDLLKEAK
jgi:hypothetical protein